jgi:hypothetical protein
MSDQSKDNSSRDGADVSFSSNCMRLSACEWLIAAAVVGFVVILLPVLWQRIETFEPGPDYRVPYELSNDYWLYERYAKWAAERHDTLVVGDSVIWGHYVPTDATLSHHLNRLTGREQFANLGLDGTHPAVLEGLLRYYGKPIAGKKVILHLNLLWMTSPKHDLQTDKEHHFNHPELVCQFTPKIPCYKASSSERMSAVVKRNAPLFAWTSHLNIAYFDSNDVPTWSIDHPYRNPLKRLTLRLPAPDYCERADSSAGAAGRNSFDWVELETSLQWRCFRRAVRLLRERNNRVFVLLGPFNEHKLAVENLVAYRTMQKEIEAWLERNGIAYYVAPALPAELYADTSHPLSQGYAELAAQLFGNDVFVSTILNSASD